MTLRSRSLTNSFAAIFVLAILTILAACNTASANVTLTPDPAVDDSLAATSSQQTVVLAGGCFWGLQLVFENVKGVLNVTSGYSGGTFPQPSYEMVSSGQTGHAESVKIVYDPSKVTFGTLLKVFFSITTDPTELNRQGPDEGTQYRSIIFYGNDNQKRIANAYIDQVNQANVFKRKIVTQVVPAHAFYQAEGYHQDFAVHNPNNPYISTFDLPKLDNLKKSLPNLYAKKVGAPKNIAQFRTAIRNAD